MLRKMRRRGRPAKSRVPAELSTPTEEHIDESVNVPIPPPVPSEPSQAGPSHPPEPAGVNIPLDLRHSASARANTTIGVHLM